MAARLTFRPLQAVLHPCMRCPLHMERVGGRLLVVPVGIKRKHWKKHQEMHDAAQARVEQRDGELEHPQAA